MEASGFLRLRTIESYFSLKKRPDSSDTKGRIATFNTESLPSGNIILGAFSYDRLNNIGTVATINHIIDRNVPKVSNFIGSRNTNIVTLNWSITPTNKEFVQHIFRSPTPIPTITNSNINTIYRTLFVATCNARTRNYVDNNLSDSHYYYSILVIDNDLTISRTDTSVFVAPKPLLVDHAEIHATSPQRLIIEANKKNINANPTATVVVNHPSDRNFAGFILRLVSPNTQLTPTAGSLITTYPKAASQSYTTGYFSNANLSEGTHLFAIFAYDTQGNIGTPVTVNYIIDRSIPLVINLTASSNSKTATLHWGLDSAASSTDRFYILRNTTPFPTFTSANINNFIQNNFVTSGNAELRSFVETLQSDGTYYYSVLIGDNQNNISRADTSVIIDTVSPYPVRNIIVHYEETVAANSKFLSDGHHKISVRDSLSSDYAGFIFRRVSPNTSLTPTSGHLIAIQAKSPTSSVTTLNFSTENLPEGTHYFAIYPYDRSGNIGTPTTINTTIKRSISDITLTGTRAQKAVTLNWILSTNEPEIQFQVLRRTSPIPTLTNENYKTLSESMVITTHTSSVRSLTQTNLEDGIYYYAVLAFDHSGNITRVDTTLRLGQPAPIQNAAITKGQKRIITLSWRNPTDDTFAQTIIRKSMFHYPTSNIDGELVAQLGTENTHYTEPALASGKTYYYSLFSKDSLGNISQAATASIAPAISQADFIGGDDLDQGSLNFNATEATQLMSPEVGTTGTSNLMVLTTLRTNSLKLGTNLLSAGIITLPSSNSKLIETGDLKIGVSGYGKMLQSKGEVNVSGKIILASESTGRGYYILQGGSVSCNEFLIRNQGQASAFTWTGGELHSKSILGSVANTGGSLLVYSHQPTNITGSYTQSNSGDIHIILGNRALNRAILNGRLAANTPALLNISGEAAISGKIKVSSNGYTPQLGDRIRLLSSTGTFRVLDVSSQSQSTQFELPTLSSGLTWNTSDFATTGVISVSSTSSSLFPDRPLNYPNPFTMSAGTQIGYTLNRDADIELRIYTTWGQEAFRASYASASEGGKSGYNKISLTSSLLGGPWPSGVYFYVLINNGSVVGKGKLAVLPE